MTTLSTYHSSCGGFDFLGLRRGHNGAVEIVYDDGVARRRTWRVLDRGTSEAKIGDALKRAVNQAKVLPALYAELKKRSIAIEAVV